MPDYYDRTGRPVEMMEWASLFGTPDYKHVAYTEVTSASDPAVKYRVSTVWLGINHNYLNGPPHIFETMVFADTPDPERYRGVFEPDPAWMDMLCRRYSNELDAKLGHQETVILVAATVPDEVISTEYQTPAPPPGAGTTA
ncbi:hypothetical protein [Streptomyces sp. NPDC010273]|uniref:hypothetical protein n=1 Tax=Streptomyces sp. NPDC010273 TaxID=3364829 RepID=UPI0036EE5A83